MKKLILLITALAACVYEVLYNMALFRSFGFIVQHFVLIRYHHIAKLKAVSANLPVHFATGYDPYCRKTAEDPSCVFYLHHIHICIRT